MSLGMDRGPSVGLRCFDVFDETSVEQSKYFRHRNFFIKDIGSDVHTSVYDKFDDFGFLIVNFPWLSDDVPRLSSYGLYISQSVRFTRCCTSALGFNSKIFKSLPNY